MNKPLLTLFALIGLFMGIILNISPCEAASFGSSPPWVKNDRMFPGDAFEQVITLSRSDSELASRAEVRKDGDAELLKWFTIENENNLLFEVGQTTLPMKVTVKIPKNAEARNYKANIYLTMKAVTELGGGEVGIGMGAYILVDITVAKKPSLPGTTKKPEPVVTEGPIVEVPIVPAGPIEEPVVEEPVVEIPPTSITTPETSVPTPEVNPAPTESTATETKSSSSGLIKLILGLVVLILGAAAGILVWWKRRKAKTSDTLPITNTPPTTSPPSPAP